MSTDEQIVREALEHADACEIGGSLERALAALDRLMARTLPDLPEGWDYHSIYPVSGGWCCCIQQWRDVSTLAGQEVECGPTISSAVEAAIGKIGNNNAPC